jgi:hypothetical protein
VYTSTIQTVPFTSTASCLALQVPPREVAQVPFSEGAGLCHPFRTCCVRVAQPHGCELYIRSPSPLGAALSTHGTGCRLSSRNCTSSRPALQVVSRPPP